MPKRILRTARRKLYRAVDHAVLASTLTPPVPLRDPIEALSHDSRMEAMNAIHALYRQADHGESRLFTRSAGIRPEHKHVRAYGKHGAVWDLCFESDFSPLWTPESAEQHYDRMLAHHQNEPGSSAARALAQSLTQVREIDARLGPDHRYGRVARNQLMHARWFRHADGPRPCAVILHGYLGGRLPVEERMWPVRALFEGGMDVVLTVLPLHGVRSDPRRLPRLPEFPSSDPRLAIEGFRHLVHDHLSLFDYLLDGRVEQLGVVGMSLGGYSAALLATLDPRLAFGAFYMPLASIAEFAHRSGRTVGPPAARLAQAARLDSIYAVVSPLSRPSLLPPERTVVMAGQADMITGIDHGARLAAHFGAPLHAFAGGHILQAGRASAFAPMWHMLQSAGLHHPQQAATTAHQPVARAI